MKTTKKELLPNHTAFPLIQRQEVLNYLVDGKNGGSGYKEGNIPIVSENELRTLLLKAGYTELALSRCFFGVHSDVKKSKRYPQDQNERILFTLHSKNRYNMPINITRDAVNEIFTLVHSFKPDLPEGKDSLRERVLSELAELDELKKQLQQSGKDFLSLSKWAFTLDGKIIFWLNPIQQQKYSFGWYSLDDLKGWLNDDPNCKVIRKDSENERPKKYKRFNFKAEYKKSLRRFLGPGRENKRMMNILLLGCPFPDIVQRYSHKVLQ
ncbi:hypothetical protein KA017_01360 [Candidatus Woesebacteria bacterium]|nr:hypothetical protein [Candidatus Woesebacteria bacterium]